MYEQRVLHSLEFSLRVRSIYFSSSHLPIVTNLYTIGIFHVHGSQLVLIHIVLMSYRLFYTNTFLELPSRRTFLIAHNVFFEMSGVYVFYEAS